MQLTYIMPSPALRDCLSIYCCGDTLGVALSDTLPALLGQVHFRLSGTSVYEFADGRMVPGPAVAFCGPFNQAFRIHMSADFRFVGLGMLPMGWEALFGFPAASLADQVIDGGAVWRQSALETLLDQMAMARVDTERTDILERFVLDRMADRRRMQDWRTPAIDRWIERSGALSLDTLTGDLDVSARHLSRLTQSAHGATPKVLAMKYRALRAAADLAVSGEAGLADAMAGYADQSHFIRDFRRFVGWTPHAYLRDRSPLARMTITGRWAVGARRPLILWS